MKLTLAQQLILSFIGDQEGRSYLAPHANRPTPPRRHHFRDRVTSRDLYLAGLAKEQPQKYWHAHKRNREKVS